MENAFEQLGNSIKRLESKMDIQYKIVRWTIVVAFTLIGILVTVFKFV